MPCLTDDPPNFLKVLKEEGEQKRREVSNSTRNNEADLVVWFTSRVNESVHDKTAFGNFLGTRARSLRGLVSTNLFVSPGRILFQ